MKNLQKGSTTTVLLVVIIILLSAICVYLYNDNKQPLNQNIVNDSGISIPKQTDNIKESDKSSAWKIYSDGFIQFEYPSLISVNKQDDSIILSHSIAYKHPNPCDFRGDGKPYDKITDFKVVFNVVNKDIKGAVEAKGKFPGWDYVSKNPITVGALRGYRIQVGMEGCGEYQYYLGIAPNVTLIINQDIVTELSGIIADQEKYLQIPGIITPAKEVEYINRILSSFKVIS